MKSHLVSGRYAASRILIRDRSFVTILATDRQVDRELVVALHRDDGSTDTGDFRRRAELLTEPSEGSLVPVSDRGHDGQWWFAAFEAPTLTLASALADGPLDAPTVREIAIDLIVALDGFHRRGLAHGALSPGAVYLSDHGARIAIHAVASLPGEWGERHAWTPTERLAGAVATPRGDIWSLGAVLLAALVGPGPGSVGDEEGDQLAHDSERTNDHGLMAAIAACLLADPDERPSSLGAVTELLEAEGPTDASESKAPGTVAVSGPESSPAIDAQPSRFARASVAAPTA